MNELISIENLIGYYFKDKRLLEAAFTHSSYVNEHSATSNERIEFLGDCVLNFIVGEKLYHSDPKAREGALSSRRAALISRSPLARIVDGLGLIKYLKVGAGVDKAAFSEKARSDLFEALLGAVYIDGGLDSCRTVLDTVFFNSVEPERDYKSELQERAAKLGRTVAYSTVKAADGFISTVEVGGAVFTGAGKTKHLSQIAAARAVLDSCVKQSRCRHIHRDRSLINMASYYGCENLSAIKLSSSLSRIGQMAFENAGVTELVIPDSVAEIGYDALGCSKLKKLTLPEFD